MTDTTSPVVEIKHMGRHDFASARDWQNYRSQLTREVWRILTEHGHESYAWHHLLVREHGAPMFYNRMTNLLRSLFNRCSTDRADPLPTVEEQWAADEYQSVMDGHCTLVQWQHMTRQTKMKKAARNISPSNSRVSFYPVFACRKNYADCGLVNTKDCQTALKMKFSAWGHGLGDDVYIAVKMQSNWLTHWALQPESHRALPDNYMFCAAQEQKHLQYRHCAKVKYIRSMTGCRYVEGEGYTAMWNGRFVLAQSRRALVSRYKRLMSEVILEHRFKHLTDGLVDNKAGRVDKMTQQSIYEAISSVIDDAFDEGLVEPSQVLAFYDARKGGE